MRVLTAVGLTQRDWWLHSHGNTEHAHAWASVEHDHLLWEVCKDEACEGDETHNIHPRPKTMREE